MKDPLAFHILSFLKDHWLENRPLLLGLSGGTDSLALLHLLLESQKILGFHLGIAHVDHGWRAESAKEAAILKGLADHYNLPFHQTVLNLASSSNNLEALCREERLKFFKNLCQSYGYQAILLGHHLDDQAETILKKIFEGANLNACFGIAPISSMDDLVIWRPLLIFSKKQLVEWLEKRGLTPFEDSTNFDIKFLRARMRVHMIPHLEELFGKGIIRSLAHFAKESHELNTFMSFHLSQWINSIESNACGTFLDLSSSENLTPFEMKFLIRFVSKKESCFPSKDMVEDTADHLIAKSAMKYYVMGKHILFVDKKTLYVSPPRLFDKQIEQVERMVVQEELTGAWKVVMDRLIVLTKRNVATKRKV